MGLDDDEWPDAGAFKSEVIAQHVFSSKTRKDFTPTEAKMMDLVAKGMSNQEIGIRLGVQTKSVERRLTNAYQKMGVGKGHGTTHTARVKAVLFWLGLEVAIEEWSMACEFCDHAEHGLKTRFAAVGAGHAHVEAEHASDPEYGFRIRGIRRKV